MFVHLCAVLCVAGDDGEGVAAVAAVVLADVDDVDEDVCVVAALATAMLAPNPAPIAAAPIAPPIKILPSLVFIMSASMRSSDGPLLRTPVQTADFLRRCSPDSMKPPDYQRK
jgi:hypothetical protein